MIVAMLSNESPLSFILKPHPLETPKELPKTSYSCEDPLLLIAASVLAMNSGEHPSK
jgi:hypothetical protein